MNKKITLLILMSISSLIFAQKNEFSVDIGTNFLYFTGASAESETFINYSEVSQSGYTNNPYGSKTKFGLNLGANFKRITGYNLIFGAGIGYEMSKSNIKINQIWSSTSDHGYSIDADGSTKLEFNHLNIEPFIGYRIPFKEVSFDITGGLEYVNILSAKEKGKAKDEFGTAYTTSIDRKTIKNDLRPKIQISVNYSNYGFYAGYSFGLKNYKSGYIGGTNEVYSRTFKVGLSYRFTE